MNWSQITAHIVIGTCPMEFDDLRRIHAEAGASGVLSLQHDDCLANWDIDYTAMNHIGAELGLIMERYPIRDFDVPDMRRCLPAAIMKLANLRAQKLRTYVHCTAGLGRAPLVVLGYLTLVEGYSPNAAIRLILDGRPGAAPSWEAYHGCCQDLIARHRVAIERRAYELYKLGVHGNASADWCQAQAEVLHSVLTNQTAD